MSHDIDILEEIYSPGYGTYGPSRNGGTVTAPARRPDPKKEYVAAGYAYGQQQTPKLLSSTLDEIVQVHGPRIYDAMDRDPAVCAAKMALKLGIVAGGMDLAPAEKPDAGVKELDADQKLSEELVDFVWRNVERLPDFEPTVFDLLEAVRTGVRLAEFTLELAADGEDAGKLVLKSLRVKPNDVWQFVVDDYNAVTGIQAGKNGADRAVYPPDKFVWLSWEPRDGDPRGTSVYRAAFESWNLKLRTFPQLYKYLVQFGSPSLVGKTAEGEVDRAEVDPDTGLATGSMVSPQQYMADALVQFQSGSVMVVAAGAEVLPIAPSGNGEAFHKAIDLFDRQITHAILGTTSATMEAEHDSRAKGQTGENIVGLKIELGRKALASALRGLFRRLIALNYGDDVAARLTPLVTFGQVDQPDRAALWSAAATLWANGQGYLGESQRAEVDQMIGLPIRDADADEAKAKAKQEEAMKQQAAMAPPVTGGKPGAAAPPNGTPKPKPKPAEFGADDRVADLEARLRGVWRNAPADTLAGRLDRYVRDRVAAEFALGAPMPGPWHDADIIEARAILNRTFPSAAAMRRWEKGEETDEGRRFHLESLVEDAKARLTTEGQQLLVMLNAVENIAQFASPWETVARWRDGVAQTLRRFYVAGALALGGPDALDETAWGALQRENEIQVGYLDGFAGDLLSGKQARDGTLGARAGMYAQSIKTVAQAVERQKAAASGLTEEKRVHVGDPADMCPECRAEQAKKWQPIGTLKAIGACLCKTGCHCHMEFR